MTSDDLQDEEIDVNHVILKETQLHTDFLPIPLRREYFEEFLSENL